MRKLGRQPLRHDVFLNPIRTARFHQSEGPTGCMGTRTDIKWDTVLPCMGHRCSCMSNWGVGGAHTPAGWSNCEPREQAGASNHAQTSILQWWVRRKGARLGNSLYRFRECPDHRFLSRQLASPPAAASGKQPSVQLASAATWDGGKAMRRVLPKGIDTSSAPRPKRSR